MSNLAKVSRQVLKAMSNPRLAAVDKEADRQRVNSYIADVLKDAHVLYAKLARLHGDFGGTELKELEKVSEVVLSIGGKLASFSKAFNEGKAKMNEPDVYGEGSSSGGGGDFPSSFGGGNSDPFATEAPAAPSPSSSEDSGLDFGDAAGGDEESGGGGSDPIDIEFDFEDDDEGGEPEGGKSEAKSEEKKPAKKPAKKSED